MKSIITLSIAIIFNGFISSAIANEKMVASLCEKVKECALKQMKSEELPESVKKMMQPMLNKMCSKMVESYNLEKNENMKDESRACLMSMQKLSCESLMKLDDGTKECKILEKKYSN